MKGQITIELMAAVSIILLLFAALTYVSIELRGETMHITSEMAWANECENIANTINVVYAAGDGTEAEAGLASEVMVRPGLVQFNASGNTYFCPIDDPAVGTVHYLNESSRYLITNGGGVIGFQAI
ncbi:hypothetical protein ACFLRF_01390 [Candidatus Altiarchaeota archaeon]